MHAITQSIRVPELARSTALAMTSRTRRPPAVLRCLPSLALPILHWAPVPAGMTTRASETAFFDPLGKTLAPGLPLPNGHWNRFLVAAIAQGHCPYTHCASVRPVHPTQRSDTRRGICVRTKTRRTCRSTSRVPFPGWALQSPNPSAVSTRVCDGSPDQRTPVLSRAHGPTRRFRSMVSGSLCLRPYSK